MPSPSKVTATVLMSGGVDSTACAYFLKQQGARVRGLFVDHGQPAARREAKALRALALKLRIPMQATKLTGADDIRSGEIPGRNAMLIFSAVFLTRAQPGLLAIGIHAGTPYFDCSAAFLDSAARLVSEQTDGRLSLVAPFLQWSKRDVFDYFKKSRLPLTLTYSCEAGTNPPCGVCASCEDRGALK